jgi:hypothetical protein
MRQSEKQLLKTYSSPQLKEPFLVAAGPGTANIGLRTVDYLREKLGAELFAEIEPGDFFTPPYSFAFRDGLIDIVPIELRERRTDSTIGSREKVVTPYSSRGIPILYQVRFRNSPGMYWRLLRVLGLIGYTCQVHSSPISTT